MIFGSSNNILIQDELGKATICGQHRLPHPDDDQHELNHWPPSADGDPTDSGNLLQLLLANWCLQVGGAVQLLPLLQLQEEADTSSATATPPPSNVSVLQQPYYNTVAKETFLPQQLKKWKCIPIKLFDIIKVANDFCKSSNFWKKLKCSKKWKC